MRLSGTAVRARKVTVGIALACAATVLLAAVAVAAGRDGSDEPPVGGQGPPLTPAQDQVFNEETLRCTGLKKPVNFEVFSAGPAPAGLPLTGTLRHCDHNPWWPNNYVNYEYGSCEIPDGANGCYPPLQVQTWPACQRAKDEYTMEGEPLPSKRLADYGDAEVVEFTFPANRIEVYTKKATIVLFGDMKIARKAVRLLRPQERGEPPADSAADLRGVAPEPLPAPIDGSTEGTLEC